MDRELFKELSVVSEFYEDVRIDDQELSLLFVGTNGIYVCVDQADGQNNLFHMIKRKFNLQDQQLFLFLVSATDSGSFYDYTNGFVEMKNIYEAYQNCYYNHLIPQADLFHISFSCPSDYCQSVEYEADYEAYEDDAEQYVMPVISEKQLDLIKNKLEAIFNEPVTDGNYRIYPDGRMEIKRAVTESVGGVISTFVEKGTAYFPCMEADGDQFFLLTLLGGLFGLHKFKTGNYLRGILYALTCGCCGVFYILDLLSIIFGSYSYSMISSDKSSGTVEFQKKRFYSRPLKNKKKAMLLTLVAAVFAFLLVKFVYISALDHINVILSSVLSHTQMADGVAEMFELY